MSLHITSLSQGTKILWQRQDLLTNAALTFSLWKQRTKDLHSKFGEVVSTYFFRRLRPRKHRNHVFMLKDAKGT